MLAAPVKSLSIQSPSRRVPELLAPAGDWEAMRAAVANGADAVYFGLSAFNARYRAANFPLEELPKVMEYLHSHNVRGYVTFNVLVFSDELPVAVDFIRAIAAAGADAIIVQDLGIAMLAHRMFPNLAVHGSTQMTLTEPLGIEFVRGLGVSRVILARELCTVDISRITPATPMPLEVFVHGALCVAYSGQCLTSEALGGRSANRGQCAQACRLPYELFVDGTRKDLGDKSYLLSPQDLAAFDLVDELADLGISCLKVEGRLKSAQYVAATTQTYRAAIDSTAAGRAFVPSSQQKLDLAQSFSRGFTHGFLDGVDHQKLVHARFPKSRGVRAGKVIGKTPRGIIVKLESNVILKIGDGIVFDEGHPEQDEQGGRIIAVMPQSPKAADGIGGNSERGDISRRGGSFPLRANSKAHGNSRSFPNAQNVAREQIVEISLYSGDVNLRAVADSAIVWKTDDPEIRKRLSHSYSRDQVTRRVKIHADVIVLEGSDLEIIVRDESGHHANVKWDRKLERAQKFPATREVFREQFGRLGDTPFELGDVSVNGDPRAEFPPVMIPKSVLNDLRRQGTQKLVELRSGESRQAQAESEALENIRREILSLAAAKISAQPQLHVLCRTMEQLEAVLEWRARIASAGSSHSWHGLPAHVGDGGTSGNSVNNSSSPINIATTGWKPVPLAQEELGGRAEARTRSDPHLPPCAEAHPTKMPGHTRPVHPGLIWCEFEDIRKYPDAVSLARAAGTQIGLATVRIIKPAEHGLLKQVAAAQPDAILIRNLAGLSYLTAEFPDILLVADYALNIANELTASILARHRVRRMTPSYDLNWKQMAMMFTHFPPVWFEAVIHQQMPMFHMEHCVFAHTLSSGKDYRDCGRPCENHKVDLRNRAGVAHPLVADVGCRNTVYNGTAESAAEYVPKMLELGIRHFRVELLREDAEAAKKLIEKYARVIAGEEDAKSAWKQLKVLNQLGVTRGTLE